MQVSVFVMRSQMVLGAYCPREGLHSVLNRKFCTLKRTMDTAAKQGKRKQMVTYTQRDKLRTAKPSTWARRSND